MRPFPLRGLVPYRGQVVPVINRYHHPQHGWTYTIHTRQPDRELVVEHDVPHAVILAGIAAVAHYAVGQEVVLQGRHRLAIAGRRWSYSKGTVLYVLARPNHVGNDKRPTHTYTQERIFQLVEADEVPEAYRRPGLDDIELMM